MASVLCGGIVPLFGRRQPEETIRVSGDRARRALVKQIARNVSKLDPGPDAEGVDELQLVIQVVGPSGYAEFKAARERAWRKQQAPWATGGWPPRIETHEIAGLLLAIPAGRVGPAAGKHPRGVDEPRFTVGRPSPTGDAEELALTLLAGWLDERRHRGPARLAPPAIETMHGKQPASRRLLAVDSRWSLPVADGLSPSSDS